MATQERVKNEYAGKRKRKKEKGKRRKLHQNRVKCLKITPICRVKMLKISRGGRRAGGKMDLEGEGNDQNAQ